MAVGSTKAEEASLGIANPAAEVSHTFTKGNLPVQGASPPGATKPGWILLFGEILGFGGTGFLFGAFLQKGRVHEPKVIQDQMLMTDFTMMKMFLAAVAASQVVFALSEIANLTLLDGSKFRDVRKKYQSDRGSRGLVSVVVGSFLLGTGFALAGACPGTVYSQIGAAIPGSFWVLLGAALGVLVFTVSEPYLKRNIHSLYVLEKKGVEHHVSLAFPTLALLSAAILAAAVIVFELFAPASIGYGDSSTSKGNIIFAKSWSAWVAGAVIGALQLPSLFLTSHPLGMSSAFVALLSPFGTLLTSLNLISPTTELAAFAFPSKKSFLQMLQLGATVAGAATASVLGSTHGVVAGLTRPGTPLSPSDAAVALALPIVWNGVGQVILGGFTLFFGARLAKGCTSGHGISGFGLLNSVSVVAVPSMFAGGIGTAYLMKWLVT